MGQEHHYSIGYALLCVQGALLDAVTPHLRAVVVDLYHNRYCMFLQLCYEGEMSEEDIESLSCAITEASAGMEAECLTDPQIERIDFPKPIPFLGVSPNGGYLAFLRWEPGGSSINPANIFPLSEATDIAPFPEAYAVLAASNALLGKISPELRAVTIAVPSQSNIVKIRFFHDQEINMEMLRLWEQAASEIHASLGATYTCDTQVIRSDFPQKISIQEGRYAYFRKEPIL